MLFLISYLSIFIPRIMGETSGVVSKDNTTGCYFMSWSISSHSYIMRLADSLFGPQPLSYVVLAGWTSFDITEISKNSRTEYRPAGDVWFPLSRIGFGSVTGLPESANEKINPSPYHSQSFAVFFHGSRPVGLCHYWNFFCTRFCPGGGLASTSGSGMGTVCSFFVAFSYSATSVANYGWP